MSCDTTKRLENLPTNSGTIQCICEEDNDSFCKRLMQILHYFSRAKYNVRFFLYKAVKSRYCDHNMQNCF